MPVFCTAATAEAAITTSDSDSMRIIRGVVTGIPLAVVLFSLGVPAT